MLIFLKLCTIFAVFSLSSPHLIAQEDNSKLKALLDSYKKDMKLMMDRPLLKRDANSNKIIKTKSYPKESKAFKQRDRVLKEKISKEIFGDGKAGWEPHDNPARLFEPGVSIETDLKKLKAEASLSKVPWSSDYWALAKTGIAFRYQDQDLKQMLVSEMDKYDNKVKFSTTELYYTQPQDYQQQMSLKLQSPNVFELKLDSYSPAEKYDLLMGDTSFSLTKSSKYSGKVYEDEDGFVEMWMGLCHGWAPVSYMVDRPLNPVTLLAADGKTPLTFYQDDIKALLVLKWSQSQYSTLFVGGRCNEKADDITKDEDTGKILNSECFDNNPGTWHVVVANKIGKLDQSLVMDATFDYEVWNQPVYSYKARYFNIRTESFTQNLDDAIISFEDYEQKDLFKDVRNKDPRATHIVGVMMSVVYISETDPRHGEPEEDRLVEVSYLYDLELSKVNDEYKIVGGEWYTNKHPDFMWTPKKGQEPTNAIDQYLAQYALQFDGDAKKLNDLLGNKLSKISQLSAKNDGSPLDFVIKELVNLSNKK